jgi:integrase
MTTSESGQNLRRMFSGIRLAANRHILRRRFHTACRVLGWVRLRTLTIHRGRHTFISHALGGERTLAEVKAAAGHASLLTTRV